MAENHRNRPGRMALGLGICVVLIAGICAAICPGRCGVPQSTAELDWTGPHAGLDFKSDPPRIDPVFLLTLIHRQLPPLHPDHPFRGRRVQILDLRGELEHGKARIPTALPIDPETLASEQVEWNLADLEANLVIYGDHDGLRKTVLARRSRRVFEVADGWESILDQIPQHVVPIQRDSSGKVRDPAMRKPIPAGAVPEITSEELKAKLENQADHFVLIYVGEEETFRKHHIPQAILVPFADLDRYLAERNPMEEMIFYCGCCAGASDGVSGFAAYKAINKGFKKIRHLHGHLKAWEDLGYATESSS